MLFTGCDSEASRIAFDKVLTKQKCIEAGVPTAKFVVVNSEKAPLPKDLQLPLVVKPVRQGSSVGLQFVERAEDWQNALAEALKFDSEVLVEEKIAGRETTVGILDDKALPIVEVRPKTGSYDYKNKYTAGCTEYFCPADFDLATTGKIQAAALGVFRAIGGRDYARVDVMVRENGEPVVLEVNTLPGMTETSLLPKAAAAGLSYEELCQRMIDLALKRKIGQDGRKNGRQHGVHRKNLCCIDELMTMWFKREKKNRRLHRGHLLDVKLRSDQVRATRTRLAAIAFGVLFGTVFGLYLFWRSGEWALDKFVYENSEFAIQNSRCRRTV